MPAEFDLFLVLVDSVDEGFVVADEDEVEVLLAVLDDIHLHGGNSFRELDFGVLSLPLFVVV